MTLVVMFGNGAGIGMGRIIIKDLNLVAETLKDLSREIIEWFVAGPGTTLITTAASRIAAGESPISGAALLVFELPGTLNLLLFYPFTIARQGDSIFFCLNLNLQDF